MNNRIIIALLCAVLIAVAVFGGITISSLNNSINELYSRIGYEVNTLSSSISGLESSIAGITADIEATLEKQSSIISDYSISYGNPDANTLTGKVTVSVNPKEYTENTSAVLYIGGSSVIMSKSGNSFTGTIPVKINAAKKVSVAFSEDGASKSESLPEEIYYGWLLKQSLQIEHYGDVTNYDGQIYVSNLWYYFYSELGDSAVSAKIVGQYEGQERWSQNISSPNSGEPQQFEIVVGKEVSDNDYYGSVYEGYEVYIEVVGSLGFTYRYCLDGTEEVKIYGKDGKEIVFSDSYDDIA